MPELVALDLPGGPMFVDAIQRVWAAGDAIFPIDRRLPASERNEVMAVVAPSSIIESDGERRSLGAGRPVEVGDALVIATSGTTGLPKGVVHTHHSLTASAAATHTALDVDPRSDRWLACLPLAHIGGLSVVTRSLISGMPVEVHDGFDARSVVDAASRGATLTSLVSRALAQIDASLFRAILLGGAAPPPGRPSNVLATYGLTETASGVIYERQPLEGLEIRIDEADEIWLRGPMMLRAYRDATATSLDVDPKDAEGWFATGDLGLWGDDGRLMVEGRKGDVINTGAEKVWPERAEAILQKQPGVVDVALVGRTHPEWGQEVIALVVPDGDGPSLDQLRDAVRTTLPVWYAPRAIELVEVLPRTALGKLQRVKLRH